MGTYRYSRNIEASLIDYITAQLAIAGWSDINVEKGFARVYSSEVPVICLRLSETTHTPAELGSNATYRIPLILIDIFGSSDGNRLDLKDFLVSIFKNNIAYYDYTIANGVVSVKTRNGSISVIEIRDTPINFGTNKNELAIQDRYRHLLTLTVDLGRLET